jgi:3-deoxy-D-manno-octulosonic-acid transferase
LADLSYGTGGIYRGLVIKHGGQNPIEAAKLGAAILHGPHVWNFAEIYSALDKVHGAERIESVDRLVAHLAAWLNDPDARARVVAAAKWRCGESERGAGSHARLSRPLSDATAVAAAG